MEKYKENWLALFLAIIGKNVDADKSIKITRL